MTSPDQSAAHPDLYRQAMRMLASGVSVITARDDAEAPIGMTATALTSLSMEPPSILFCAQASGSLAPHLVAGRPVGVNILSGDQGEIADAFSGATGMKGLHRFAVGNWIRGQAEDIAILLDARFALECRIDEVIARYTHLIVICRVSRVYLRAPSYPGLISDGGRLSSFPAKPEVLFHAGEKGSI